MNPDDGNRPSSPYPTRVGRMERSAVRGQPRREMSGSTRIAGREGGPPSGLPEEEGASGTQRRIAFRFGLSAESRAAAFLIAKGYRILARRFRTPLGEIDIVARRRGVLVFVEVKARDSFDAAAEAIGKRQQSRIISAAQLWLAAHQEDAMRDMRFDVVLVVPGCLPRHLQAAFDASL